MQAYIRRIRNGKMPEYYEGTISSNDGKVVYHTTRWSEEGARAALMQYIYKELHGDPSVSYWDEERYQAEGAPTARPGEVVRG